MTRYYVLIRNTRVNGWCNKMEGSITKHRINGRNGERIYVEGEDICFKTGGSVEKIPLEVLAGIELTNTEQARAAVNGEDLVPHGAWCEEMPSVGGKSVFVVVRGRASLWVMEINKSQIPNARQFIKDVKPSEEDDESKLWVPNRAINTPLGAVFTIGTIVGILLAIFCVFSWNQPLIGLIIAVGVILMFVNIK